MYFCKIMTTHPCIPLVISRLHERVKANAEEERAGEDRGREDAWRRGGEFSSLRIEGEPHSMRTVALEEHVVDGGRELQMSFSKVSHSVPHSTLTLMIAGSGEAESSVRKESLGIGPGPVVSICLSRAPICQHVTHSPFLDAAMLRAARPLQTLRRSLHTTACRAQQATAAPLTGTTPTPSPSTSTAPANQGTIPKEYDQLFASLNSAGGRGRHVGTAGKPTAAATPEVRMPRYILHCRSFRNTIVTLTRENGEPIGSWTGGSVGFKRSGRKTYEAGYQCAVQSFKMMEVRLYVSAYGHCTDRLSNHSGPH